MTEEDTEGDNSSDPSNVRTKAVWGFIGVLAGAIVAFAGHYWTAQVGYRNADVKFARIGLSVLAGENTGTETLQARQFAISLLARSTGVEISDEDAEAWAQSGVVTFNPDWLPAPQQAASLLSDEVLLSRFGGVSDIPDEFRGSGEDFFEWQENARIQEIEALRQDNERLRAQLSANTGTTSTDQ